MGFPTIEDKLQVIRLKRLAIVIRVYVAKLYAHNQEPVSYLAGMYMHNLNVLKSHSKNHTDTKENLTLRFSFSIQEFLHKQADINYSRWMSALLRKKICSQSYKI